LTALGDGDLPLGFAVMCDTFGFHTLARGFGIIPPETVRQIGNGNMAAGRKVLTQFVSMVRSQRKAA
jgi:hypothetical protein